MAYRPLTYSGQYPPLYGRSASDVASFADLSSSIRETRPDLVASEPSKSLGPDGLCRLVDGLRRFQRDQLGRVSLNDEPTDCSFCGPGCICSPVLGPFLSLPCNFCRP